MEAMALVVGGRHCRETWPQRGLEDRRQLEHRDRQAYFAPGEVAIAKISCCVRFCLDWSCGFLVCYMEELRPF